jgi:hypothetical protein
MLLILFYGVLFSFFCCCGFTDNGESQKILGGFGEEGWEWANFKEVSLKETRRHH